jgi:hypothetical protein
VTWPHLLWSALLVPPATWLLRSVPPLSCFEEGVE